DVLLVLLAIVLLTSTFITRGIIPVALPNSSSAEQLKPDKEIVIVINENGEFFLEDTPIVLEELEKQILQKSVETPVH
ncbi:ExbD/TolR family protein, partial [Aliarcobacter lanthieri]